MLVFSWGEVRIVDEKVGPRCTVCNILVDFRGAVLMVTYVDQRTGRRIHSITGSAAGVIQRNRSNIQATDLDAFHRQLKVFLNSASRRHCKGKVRLAHLYLEDGPEFIRRECRVKIQLSKIGINGAEKRQALDMIPMKMAEKQ